MLFSEFPGGLPWRSPALSRGRKGRSGYSGYSDGWQELARNFRLTQEYSRAEDGNIALTGEIDLSHGGEFILSLGFGGIWAEAGEQAYASLLDEYDGLFRDYVRNGKTGKRV